MGYPKPKRKRRNVKKYINNKTNFNFTSFSYKSLPNPLKSNDLKY